MHEVEVIKSSDEDRTPEVELKVNINSSFGFVMIAFNKPMAILKLTKKDAREFARRINLESLK